ncbi:MAG: phosphoglucosamine mutase, partial [Candidatus Bathyarchaeia archaeon]
TPAAVVVVAAADPVQRGGVQGIAEHVDQRAVSAAVARDLGCSVYTVNAEVDGRFPGRESEPRPDNLGGLRALVEASGADVGVAFDGDGDRAIFVDERGGVHWGDRSFALVAREFLTRNPGEAVATAVSSSRVIEDVVSAGGGRVVWTRVGSVVISRTMVEEGIRLGGEENGGIMYGPHQPVRDGTMSMVLVLEIMAREGRPLSELFGELPQYSQMKAKVPCPEELKRRALEALREAVEAPKVETIDGVKLWYRDGSWILIRPSGTEPVFRLYAEADNPERVAALIEEHRELVGEVIGSLG